MGRPPEEAEVRELSGSYGEIPEIVALCESWLAQREALRRIAEHPVNSTSDPCDWHCTRNLTDMAIAALAAVGEATQ